MICLKIFYNHLAEFLFKKKQYCLPWMGDLRGSWWIMPTCRIFSRYQAVIYGAANQKKWRNQSSDRIPMVNQLR